ncbi:BnaA02g26430D [Brassica napus]|uniref:(rape) hypothetical protein n=1 Tax=Brassica napus TaxID=3708 RepID=A0A078F8D7_BRANA|nr:unnamed protein product [Brassica napus]CDY09367.1 BnaA02g26430D [Brassica napus]
MSGSRVSDLSKLHLKRELTQIKKASRIRLRDCACGSGASGVQKQCSKREGEESVLTQLEY